MPNELTLKQWIESVWFKGLARLSMIVTGVLFTGFLGAWAVVAGNTDHKVTKLEATIADVAGVQISRATDAESFQTEVRAAVAGVKADIYAVKVDIGVIKRLLQADDSVADLGNRHRILDPASP